VAIPLADDLAATKLQQWGVFLRNTTFWSRVLKVKKIIFDKTGTLTLERPLLENPEAVDALDDRAAQALAQLTHGSLHPMSRTLLEKLGHRGQKLLQRSTPIEITETPGMGIEYREGIHHWSLGRTGWKSHKSVEDRAGTEFCCDGQVVATFLFRDALRPSAHDAIKALQKRGMELHICSGDHPEKVARMATALDIPPFYARGGLKPEEKARSVKAIDAHDTLYLGDGANDSLAFDAAFVTGTPVTDRSLLESKADFYTLGAGLSFLPQLFTIAQARSRGVRQAFLFALLYNLTVIAISLMGHMNPLLAAILMPLSSLVSLAIVAFSMKNRRSCIEQSEKISYSGSDVSTKTYVAANSPP
jgi:Cu2+-exporting ATPase